MRLEGIEHHQIVVDARERRHRRDGRFLVQRGAGRIIELVQAKGSAPLLRHRRRHRDQSRNNEHEARDKGLDRGSNLDPAQ